MKTERTATIEQIIGYAFKDKMLLERAFIHSSYANEKGEESYDRLEFLGDGVLGLIVAERLYAAGRNEGDMTEKRARIVSTVPLEEAVESLGLEKFMLFGAGESRQGHAHRKVLADLFEAIVGAIYLDGGYDKAAEFVFDKLGEKIDDTLKSDVSGNGKGDLQEFCQSRKLGKVEYRTIGRDGAVHAPHFRVEVLVGGKSYAEGEGKRIKEAEHNAAKTALKIISEEHK